MNERTEKLVSYMRDEGMNANQFADWLGAVIGDDVSPRTVHNWQQGRSSVPGWVIYFIEQDKNMGAE